MIFDAKKEQWSDELLKLFNINKSLLPEVKENSYNFGKTNYLEGKSKLEGWLVINKQQLLDRPVLVVVNLRVPMAQDVFY